MEPYRDTDDAEQRHAKSALTFTVGDDTKSEWNDKAST